MEIKKFSELSNEELLKIINKHFDHLSKYSEFMNYNDTVIKFTDIYAKDNNIPYGIALYNEGKLI